MEDFEEDVYNVPPAPRQKHVNDAAPMEQARAAPPTLMPKKGNSFRISSLDLDRRAPTKMPRPAPRNVSVRKSSVDSVPDEVKKDGAKYVEDLSLDIGAMNEADSADVFLTKPLPQARARGSPSPMSRDNEFILSSNNAKVGTSEGDKNATNRPVPRPRARVQSKLQETSIFPTEKQQEDQLVPNSLGVPSLAFKNEKSIDDYAKDLQASVPSIPFAIPPDADSLEMQFDKEVNDKYGFSDESLDPHNLSTQAECSGDPFPSEKISPVNDENTDNGNYCNIESFSKMAEKEFTDVPIKATIGSTSPDTTEAAALDIETGSLCRDNSESFLSLPNSSSAYLPTTSSTTKKAASEATNLSFSDLCDLDPLWQKKSDNLNTNQMIGNSFIKQGNSHEFQQTTTTLATRSTMSTDSEESDFHNLEELCHPLFPQPPKPHFVAKPVEIPPASGNSGWQEPLAPPPPLPNVLKPAGPPPVPPRPSNSPLPTLHRPQHLEMSSEGNQSRSHAETTNIFDALPTPVFSPMSNKSDPFAGSGFDEYCSHFNARAVVKPTEPPENSVTTTPPLPTPPSPSSKPKAKDTEGLASTSKEGRDPSEDPERISRFVPPPPGAYIGDSNAEGGYTFARDDDSDSDSVDEMASTFRQNSVDDMPMSMDPRRSLATGGEPQSPKKNIREGLLNKQGGYNANKGWRKRWVVFDGSKLSYYDSNKSQVSKRIIPVSCINNVEIDVKADSYKFKVFTSLKNRVFVFSAEKRDDCTMWANVLMAAIVAQKSSPNTEEPDTQTRPDKEGFIRFANTKEYYVTITGQMLRYYQSLDDYQEGSPVHEIDMKLASVKANESKKLRLQLWVHYGHFDLIFPSEQELQQWRLAMEVAIAEGLADDTVLTKVYENISNQQCADCGAPNPHWASINLGIAVCKNCAGIHRMFDYRISRIKSLRMDTRIWTPSLVELMVTVGNANANMFWAAKLSPGEGIEGNEMMDKRRAFITKKYIEKRFADKHPLLNLKPAHGEELLKAARNDNVLDTMRILFSGADVMYRQNNDSPTAFEIVKEGRQRLVMEFLFQNGGDPQSLEEDVQDENRLREDVRLQGFLNKTGPMGKTFERRWCVIEHGALTYYVNEKTSMIKGSVDRRDMLMISAVETDRMGYQFELSTTLKDNRTFTFSSDIKDDAAEWMGTIAKLMAPVAVMEHVGMIDIKFAGYAYMKELVNEWHQTFLVFSWRVLNFMNKDLKFDYLDLRKASSIKMQDASMGYQNRGPCFVISSTKWTVYLQASLSRDTEKMYNCLLEATTGSGSSLNDQVLTPDNVPVIVDRCITHIEVHGLKERGIYRTAGQSSRVQALLDEFRKDVLSVSLSEYPVSEVADTLKRFLRELDDSVFERRNYPAWLSAAGCTELSNRLSSYEYYLKKMPNVHLSTLKRIILHLHQVAEHSAVNKMPIANLASCFAPSLMRTSKDKIHLTGEVYSQEIKIIIDLLENKDLFFHADEEERIRANNIEKAQSEIRRMEELRQSVHPGKFDVLSWLVPCQILDKDVSVNVEVTDTRTAAEAMEKLNEVLSRSQPKLARLGKYALYESLFKGDLVRPIFPNDIVAKTTNRWMEFDPFLEDEIAMSLCLRDMSLLDALDTNYQHQSHSLQAELQYSDSKSKKFKTKTVRFKQCQLAIYNKAKDSEAAYSWKVEDLSFYLGTWPKRNSPSRHCLTFLVNGEKYTKAFGHCLSFNSMEDLHQWAAMLYAVQNPDGLLSWTTAFPYSTVR